MNNQFVIVSSLFNIKREGMDGRTWDDYLKWFDVTLQIKCPMILFVTEDVVSFIQERRKDIPTVVITQTVEEIPYYYLKEKIDEIISSQEYRNKIKDPDRIECQHSLYSIVQYSKFKWLELAIEQNPFNSKFFFWMDAGGSRFFDNYDVSLEYPSSNAMEALNSMGDKFLIQMNMEYYKDLVNASTLSKDYLVDNRSYILGSMFGGGVDAIKKVSKDIDNIFLEDMISENFVNNEQVALGYLVKQNPSDYEIYERHDGKHMSLFMELGKR